jgi:hypothetical protein
MNVFKILIILSTLMVLRYVIQAVMRREGFQAGMRSALPFVVPPLVCGGPMAIALSAAYPSSDPAVAGLFALVAFAGAVALAIGLAAMHAMLQVQQRQITRLQEMLESSHDRA